MYKANGLQGCVNPSAPLEHLPLHKGGFGHPWKGFIYTGPDPPYAARTFSEQFHPMKVADLSA